jgi:hypothetical protein
MRGTSDPLGRLTALLAQLGVCGGAGVAVGAMTGFIVTVLDLIEDPLELSDVEAVEIWLLLAAFGWLALVFIFTVFVRWSAGSVVVPAFVNSVLVTALTILVALATGLFALAWLIGILAGMLIGFLLCKFYNRVTRA